MFRNICLAVAFALVLTQFVTQAPDEAAVRSVILCTFILILYGVVRGVQRIFGRKHVS